MAAIEHPNMLTNCHGGHVTPEETNYTEAPNRGR